MGWQDKVLADVRAKDHGTESMRTAFGRALKPMHLACTVGFVVYVNRAAAAMGVNRSTFVRRAVAVHAAHALGIDVRTILWESPRARAWGEHTLPREQSRGLRDDGTGIENWCPHPGCDGSHLRSQTLGTGLP
jgi:hypothetical protein